MDVVVCVADLTDKTKTGFERVRADVVICTGVIDTGASVMALIRWGGTINRICACYAGTLCSARTAITMLSAIAKVVVGARNSVQFGAGETDATPITNIVIGALGGWRIASIICL